MGAMRKQIKPQVNGNESATAKIAELKLMNATKCFEALNLLLESHNCVANVYVTIGSQKVPIAALLNVPVEVSIESR